MCKACFEECHPNCEAYYSKVATGAYCDCHTLRCKFNDKKFVSKTKLQSQVVERREKMGTEKVVLTEEHKAQVKRIYETILPVKFRWGGSGFIKVRTSSFMLTLICHLEELNLNEDNTQDQDALRKPQDTQRADLNF